MKTIAGDDLNTTMSKENNLYDYMEATLSKTQDFDDYEAVSINYSMNSTLYSRMKLQAPAIPTLCAMEDDYEPLESCGPTYDTAERPLPQQPSEAKPSDENDAYECVDGDAVYNANQY